MRVTRVRASFRVFLVVGCLTLGLTTSSCGGADENSNVSQGTASASQRALAEQIDKRLTHQNRDRVINTARQDAEVESIVGSRRTQPAGFVPASSADGSTLEGR